jgi:Tfp pilus assembly protein FimV
MYCQQIIPKAIYTTTNDVGRATKGAAMFLLAKVYLREHQWQKAADLTKQVMDLGFTSFTQAYEGLFKETNTWCSENIFLGIERCQR